MLKHYREIGGRNRKSSYIRAFPRRYFKLKPFLKIARIYILINKDIGELNNILSTLSPSLVIIDDKIYNNIMYPRKIREQDI